MAQVGFSFGEVGKHSIGGTAHMFFVVGETQPLANLNKVFGITYPICSKYGIFTYILPKSTVNVGK